MACAGQHLMEFVQLRAARIESSGCNTCGAITLASGTSAWRSTHVLVRRCSGMAVAPGRCDSGVVNQVSDHVLRALWYVDVLTERGLVAHVTMSIASRPTSHPAIAFANP